MNPTIESYLSNREFQVFISFILSIFVCFNAIPIIINISNLRNLKSNPIKRSSHANPTPVLGGVGIFSATLFSFLIWENQGEESLIHKTLAGLIMLFFMGIKDDLYALSPTKKMAFQIVAGGLVIFGSDLRIYSFFGILGVHEIPYLISVGITMLTFVVLINAINLIDGIDGLAGGIGMIASLGFGSWFLIHKHYSLASLAFSSAGALIGFLRYNVSITNKIFMGDTGSLLIGHLLSVFAVKFIHLNTAYLLDPTAMYTAPIIVVFILIVPIFDTLRVFSVRIINKKSPFTADRNHMHHLLIDNGFSHNQASFMLCSSTLFLSLSAYFSRMIFSNTQLFYLIIVLFVGYWLVGDWLDQRRNSKQLEKLRFYSNKSELNKNQAASQINTDNN